MTTISEHHTSKQIANLSGFPLLSYVEMLESFMKYTPSDHVDRKNLTQAIKKFKDLDSLFREVKIKINIYVSN